MLFPLSLFNPNLSLIFLKTKFICFYYIAKYLIVILI